MAHLTLGEFGGYRVKRDHERDDVAQASRPLVSMTAELPTKLSPAGAADERHKQAETEMAGVA